MPFFGNSCLLFTASTTPNFVARPIVGWLLFIGRSNFGVDENSEGGDGRDSNHVGGNSGGSTKINDGGDRLLAGGGKFDGGGDGVGKFAGGGGGKMLLSSSSFLLFKASSLDCISKPFIFGALLRSLLLISFFPTSISLNKLPIIGFCASKVEISMKTNSKGFSLLNMFLAIGSSFCLTLALFNLFLVTDILMPSCIHFPKSLVARR